ncbi:MAG: hypothetical protein IJT03_05220, partial [Clostridia bacterium]|nr:hypothetical protein [Clostridia bacterium]
SAKSNDPSVFCFAKSSSLYAREPLSAIITYVMDNSNQYIPQKSVKNHKKHGAEFVLCAMTTI